MAPRRLVPRTQSDPLVAGASARSIPNGEIDDRRDLLSHRTVSSFCGSLFEDGEDRDEERERCGTSFCGSDMEDDGTPRAALECRLRFFNFNMANNSSPADVGELQGPGGRGFFCGALGEPLADGHPVDVAFATLPETRLFLSDWAQKFQAAGGTGPLNMVVSQNAAQEGKSSESTVGGWVGSLAATYNGNLKSVLAFSGGRFAEDTEAMLHGRLGADSKVAGIGVPNPKKAFIARSIIEHNSGVRFVFAGAHFPVHAVRDALDGPTDVALRLSKVALARSLRKLLRRAARREIIDNRTILFLQGDLNSRTVLHPVLGPLDVMQELLSDAAVQHAIRYDLPIPEGRWYEAARYDNGALDLPVTYKYKTEVGRAYIQRRDEPGCTIGSVIASAQAGLLSKVPGLRGPELYRTTLMDVGNEQLSAWGLSFKEKDFKPLRFPSCADRVLYWAPDVLAERISIELPRGNYEVNNAQGGSDHRPVSLEVIFRMAAADQDTGSPGSTSPRSRPGGAYRASMAAAATQVELAEGIGAPAFISRVDSIRETGEASGSFADDADVPVSRLVCQSDAEDSDEQREAKARSRKPSRFGLGALSAHLGGSGASPRAESPSTSGPRSFGMESAAASAQGASLAVPGPAMRKISSSPSPSTSPRGGRSFDPLGPAAQLEASQRLGHAQLEASQRLGQEFRLPPEVRNRLGSAATRPAKSRSPERPADTSLPVPANTHGLQVPTAQMRSMDDFLRRSMVARESLARGSLGTVGGQASAEERLGLSDLDMSLTAQVSSELRQGAQNDRGLFELFQQRKQQELPRPGPECAGPAGSAEPFAPADRPRKNVSISPEEG